MSGFDHAGVENLGPKSGRLTLRLSEIKEFFDSKEECSKRLSRSFLGSDVSSFGGSSF